MKIGDLYFKTKKESYEYTKKIIYSLVDKEIKNIDEHFNFLTSLVKNHCNYIKKIGNGVKYFKVLNHFNTPSLIIIRLDNTEESISWVKCSKNTKYDIKNDLIECFRNSIEEQILNYRNKFNNDIKCNICNYENNLEVDHIYPFSKIMDEFIILNPDFPKSFSKNKYKSKIFKKKDFVYESKWKKYHYDNSTFQFLCRKCNSKKNNKLIIK